MTRPMFVCLLLVAALPAAASAASKPAAAKPGATKSATAWKKVETPAEKAAKKAAPVSKMSSGTFTGLALRSIGPATTSGRITDLAIDPVHRGTWYVAVASGGVWKTTNAGTTFKPIFDSQPSFSIGCITLDPRDPLTVWVGSGENNSQRSVSYGDGVYKSVDGGKSWENVGLKDSEHIGKILVDPRRSSVVYVAAQGPLWSAGGDRGIYKSEDGGKTWKRVLEVDEYTGANEIHFDPRNPDVLYASTYQRHRRVWTLIDGGPGSAVWKSTDAGATWKKLTNGLPEGDLGRIGLAVSPADPEIVYAIVEATAKASGVYRSTDAGANWEKMADYLSSSPQYYQELVCDPHIASRVYSLDTFVMTTDDGGKTWRRLGERHKHVDNHALWIEPENSEHLIVGCDGGLYESFDRGKTWRYFENLPITQFYKLEVDNDAPFYRVYGGTQDNNTLGGPVSTPNVHGSSNADWIVTVGGDGFQSRVDPLDPNIVYSQWQHAGLIRYDRKSGERIDIKPQPEPGEQGPRWNWDSPLIISPHLHTRLYFGAQRLYRSDDRGDSWRPVSGDLTRQLDRNRMKIMGRVWSVDAVSKNASTSFYGNLVSLSESPKQEGLIYTGSDDGLVQVTEDAGAHWRKLDAFPGIPELSYVSRLEASRHEADLVYAAFDNHKQGDFKPYLLKSRDRGRSWTSIAGDLPARGTVYCLVEDHENPKLLFVGTEFGVYFTVDSGAHWIQLKGSMPPIAVRDLAIQRRENDLVIATFGRGFYVLDDYSPLRSVSLAALERDAQLMPVKPALMYIPARPYGSRDQGSQGETHYTAKNPPFGATFTYYLKDGLKTRRERRQEAEKEAWKKGADFFYPSWDSLRAEAREEDPAIVLIVTDEDGNVIRRVTGPVSAGYHRVTWDLRYPSAQPTGAARTPDDDDDDEDSAGSGPLAAPGNYRVTLAKRVEGHETTLAGPVTFVAAPLANTSLPAAYRGQLVAFERQTARLQRAVLGATRALSAARERVGLLQRALDDTPGADPKLGVEARAIAERLRDLDVQLNGDPVIRSRNEAFPPSIVERVQSVVGGHWNATSNPTQTHRRQYTNAAHEFEGVLAALRSLIDTDLAALEARAEAAGAPWTPGRVPSWKPE